MHANLLKNRLCCRYYAKNLWNLSEQLCSKTFANGCLSDNCSKRFSKSHKEITMIESCFWKNRWLKAWNLITPSQPSVAVGIETSHLIFVANQMIGFYMKRNNGLNKRVRNCCFPVNFAKFLKELFQKKFLKRPLLLSLKRTTEHRT